MTSWASVPRTCPLPTGLPETPTAPLALRSAALSVTGTMVALSAGAWVLPLLWPGSAQAEVRAQAPAPPPSAVEQPMAPPQGAPPATSARSVVFDYSAEVAPNDVYDGPRAQAPAPLFRSLGDRIDVSAVYQGPPAQVRLVARLSSTTGWSTTVPLASEVQLAGRGSLVASLELARLEERAARVAQQTEMPFEGMTVELVAAVRDARGTWTPSVALQLTPQQLRLTGEPSTLSVQDTAVGSSSTAAPAAPTPASRLDDLLGWRPDAALTSLALTLGAAGGVVVLRRRRREDDVAQARRRLGRLLLEVRPADLAGLRVVDVASPDALARLAERYGLLVLHWTDETGGVFVVQDEATAYRWTVGEGHDPSVTAPDDQAEPELPVPLVPSPGSRTEPLPAVLPVTAAEVPAEASRTPDPDWLTALALLLETETTETIGTTGTTGTTETTETVATTGEAAAREQAVREQAVREQAARDQVAREHSERAVRLEVARREVARLEAERQEAARQEAARREAARLEAARQEAARREAERRRHLEAAQRARGEADRAQLARVEAERLERLRRTEAAEAAEALAALERTEQRAAQEQLPEPRPAPVAVAVPAPRDGDRPLPVRPVPAVRRSHEELADGPPRQAEDRRRPPSSFFEVG